jgi:hypothetical protein
MKDSSILLRQFRSHGKPGQLTKFAVDYEESVRSSVADYLSKYSNDVEPLIIVYHSNVFFTAFSASGILVIQGNNNHYIKYNEIKSALSGSFKSESEKLENDSLVVLCHDGSVALKLEKGAPIIGCLNLIKTAMVLNDI